MEEGKRHTCSFNTCLQYLWQQLYLQYLWQQLYLKCPVWRPWLCCTRAHMQNTLTHNSKFLFLNLHFFPRDKYYLATHNLQQVWAVWHEVGEVQSSGLKNEISKCVSNQVSSSCSRLRKFWYCQICSLNTHSRHFRIFWVVKSPECNVKAEMCQDTTRILLLFPFQRETTRERQMVFDLSYPSKPALFIQLRLSQSMAAICVCVWSSPPPTA